VKTLLLALLATFSFVNCKSVTVYDWKNGTFNNYDVSNHGNSNYSVYDYQSHSFNDYNIR
jgi:hypothetical protein